LGGEWQIQLLSLQNGTLLVKRIMEPHAQSPWYLHEIPAYANLPAEQVLWQAEASAGYPPAAKSARARKPRLMMDSAKIYAFIHGQRPWSSA